MPVKLLCRSIVAAALLVACGTDEPTSARGSATRPRSASGADYTEEGYPASSGALMELFIAEVGRRAPDVQVRSLGGMRVEGLRGGEAFAEATLENAWGECRPQLVDCQVVVERHARVFLRTAAEPFRVDNVRLVLFGRDVMTRHSYAALAWAEPFAGDLMSVFVLDTPETIETLRPERLDELGMTRAQLRLRALANMRRAFGPLRHEAFTPDGSVHMIQTDGGGVASDSYNAARLLLPELWRPLRELVRGELVAAAPARDVAMFTGTDEPRGVESLAFLAREMFHGEPHPVSPQLVRWSGNGWVPIP